MGSRHDEQVDAAWLARDEALAACSMAVRIHERGLTTAAEAIERAGAALAAAVRADAALVALLAVDA